MDDKQNNQNNNHETDPGERLRRLLSSSEDYDADAPTPPRKPGKADPEIEKSQSQQENLPETQEPEPKNEPDSELSESQESDLTDEQQKTEPDLDRHPTGSPDQTAGWFAEDLARMEEGSQDEAQPDQARRDQEISPEGEDSWQARYDLGSRAFVPQKPEPEQEEPSPDEPPGRDVSASTPPARSAKQETLPPPPGATRPILPNQVSESDTQATRVSPVAYNQYYNNQARQSYQQEQTSPVQPDKKRRKKSKPAAYDEDRFNAWGCLVRVVIGGLFLIILAAIVLGSLGVYQYFRIASNLPPVDDLRERAAQFETTRILDRNGNVIYEILDPNAGRRTYVPLERISPYLIAATIATEDKEYYNHPGFDPIAVARAFWQNYTAGDIVSGASTITQQLARMLLLDDTERYTRSYERKAREIVLAAEITRKYTKEEILELFLNENNYGNLAYGVQAAAETYFNTTAEKLTLAQASFLAGLPQAPSVYDIYTNRDVTLNRHKQVLILMYELSQEENCIYVSTSLEDVCINEIASAAQEIENYQFEPHDYSMRYPHWVNYIRAQLENQFDPQTIYRSGFTVYTTLDPGIQETFQEIVSSQIAQLTDKNASSGALVAMRPATGEILAMVGSADFYNEEISGQVNMALAPRQPGSSIKPLVYLAAFEKGWTPATLIWDVPTGFPPSGDPNDPREPYEPVNYDGRFHGPATVRSALANSYNVPAVKALNYVGIYDNPATAEQDGFINYARRIGISTLNREDYGLSLSLGGGDVTLLEMTNVFATLANGGRRIPAVAITRIVDHNGNVVYEYHQPGGEQVIRAEHAYLISSILSDNQARTPMFGPNSVLNLPFQVAAKTGTTNDFRDNWTLGYTPDVAIGVWVGNADYTPMQNTSGLTGAAPIWSQAMQIAIGQLTGNNPSPFVRPAGIVDRVICAISGTEPSQWCPNQRNEMFAHDQLPQPKEDDLWQKVEIDTWTGLRASDACRDYTKEEFVLNVTEESAVEWIEETSQGRDWANSIGFDSPVLFVPERECRIEDSRPRIIFAGVSDGETITSNPLDIYAVVDATSNYNGMRLEYGRGSDPVDWKLLAEFDKSFPEVDLIKSWDLFEDEVEPGEITLRIIIDSTEEGRSAEKRIRLNIQVATPTPTATPTFTITPTPTETPTPTVTPTQTLTPTAPPPTATPTQVPPTATSAADISSPTPQPTATATQATPLTAPTLSGTVFPTATAKH